MTVRKHGCVCTIHNLDYNEFKGCFLPTFASKKCRINGIKVESPNSFLQKLFPFLIIYTIIYILGGINLEDDIKGKKWTERDWYWLVGILLAIIVFIFTFRLADNTEVKDLFSFISSAVSIALAVIAIFLALKQDSDNRTVSDQTSRILREINFGLRTVDENVKRLDVRDISKLTENAFEEFTNEGNKESYSKDEVKEMFSSFSADVVDKINNQLNKKNNEDYWNDDYRIKYKAFSDNISASDLIKQAIILYPDSDNDTIQKVVEERYNLRVTKASINNVRTKMKIFKE